MGVQGFRALGLRDRNDGLNVREMKQHVSGSKSEKMMNDLVCVLLSHVLDKLRGREVCLIIILI